MDKKEHLVPALLTIAGIILGFFIMAIWTAPAEGVQWLKQSTQVIIRIGPLLDKSDAITPEVDFDVSGSDECELLKHTGAVVDMSGVALADIADCNGWYNLTLTTSHTDTLGTLVYVLHDDSICLPIWKEWMVVPANVWDSIFGSDILHASLYEIDNAGGDQTVDDLEDFADAGYDPSNNGVNVYTVRAAAPLTKPDIGSAIDDHSADINAVYTGVTAYDTDAEHAEAVWGAAVSSYADEADFGGELGGLDPNVTLALAELAEADANMITVLAELAEADANHITIIGDSNELQTDLADGGRLDLLLDTAAAGGVVEAQSTTVNTVTTKRVFTLAAGVQNNQAYKYNIISVQDATDSHWEVRVIRNYIGSSRQVTLNLALTFTPANGDTVHIAKGVYLAPPTGGHL